jgi:hypothetical protein
MNRGAAFDCRSRDKDTNISREYKRHAKVYEYRYEVIDPAEKSYGLDGHPKPAIKGHFKSGH